MKSILLGLDAFDPGIFEDLHAQNQMPNLGKFVTEGKYARFSVSNPPQSEVSWTSIATGQDPGVHGMFDFVHRDPASYTVIPSLLVTKSDWMGTNFIPPFNARTIFEQATIDGFPATSLWWPATFPARLEIPVRTMPGLGTPDIQGRLGVGAVYSPDTGLMAEKYKTAVELLTQRGKNVYAGLIHGLIQKTRQGNKDLIVEFQLTIIDEDRAKVTVSDKSIELQKNSWSPIFELTFKTGWMTSIRAITRVILTQINPEPRLYMLPLQIHPLHTPFRYATPPGFVRETWNGYGPFLTLGWPQDTTGLDEGWINDDQFIALCNSIDETREKIFFNYLGKFQEGVLANVFDTLDRVQHMFLHDRPDIVKSWYLHLDNLIGQVMNHPKMSMQERTRLLIVSDHGFTRFDYKLNLNRWLIQNNYLVVKDGSDPGLGSVDWQKSKAYAVGLNSLYLNIQGREGQGCVTPDEIEPLRQKLHDELMEWKGPDNRPVFQHVYFREEVFHGPYIPMAPDLVMGYASGYRASAETGLGKWKSEALTANNDHWHADHCIDPEVVPGVIFSNFDLKPYPKPSFRDVPQMVIGKELEQRDMPMNPPSQGNEQDQKILEERLKGLGYL